ncbi:polysaccharide pyruvyl transferase family protein [Pseudomonas sp. NPDC077186]|uniref:polysaccharide pyruvyl transferase family protein n=1 Tax=Pseudomonas sp. NPDC077186 TaxID=3364421 RepID=UPI0037CC8030
MSGEKMIVVTNVFGPLNKGDWELFSRLVQALQERLPAYTLGAIARDKELTESYFPDVQIGEQIGKVTNAGALGRLQIMFYIVISLLSVRLRIFEFLLPVQQRKSLDMLRRASLVVACPGGFLEDSSKSYLTHLVQLIISIWLGKKLVLAPMSVGPISGFFSRSVLKYVLSRCDKIYVRELYSKDFVEGLGLQCVISDDIAFMLINEVDTDLIVEKKWIACTVIEWSFPLSDEKALVRARYIGAMIDSLNYLQEKFGLDVYFIRQVHSDMPAILEVAKGVKGGYRIGDESQDPLGVVSVLRSSCVVVASRFHSYIFSMAARCPGVAISYLPKTTGMLKMYDLDDYCLDIYTLNSRQIIAAVEAVYLNADIYRAKIDEVGARVKVSSSDFINSLSALLEG